MRDGEAREAIAKLGDRLHAVESRTDSRIDRLGRDLGERLSQLDDRLAALAIETGGADSETTTLVEVLEQEVNSLRVDVAGVIETQRQIRDEVAEVNVAMTKLVARLSGALSASEIWPSERR
jgi:hypothetical protein